MLMSGCVQVAVLRFPVFDGASIGALGLLVGRSSPHALKDAPVWSGAESCSGMRCGTGAIQLTESSQRHIVLGDSKVVVCFRLFCFFWLGFLNLLCEREDMGVFR